MYQINGFNLFNIVSEVHVYFDQCENKMPFLVINKDLVNFLKEESILIDFYSVCTYRFL